MGPSFVDGKGREWHYACARKALGTYELVESVCAAPHCRERIVPDHYGIKAINGGRWHEECAAEELGLWDETEATQPRAR